MKKYFIIAVLALVASAACTKVETIDNTPAQKITFQAANYTAATKAGPVSVLDDFESFKCLAYLHAEGIDIEADGTDKGTYQNFFGTAGETISVDDPDNPTEWAPSHPYYWPKGTLSYVNFVGWYGTTGSAATAPTINYSKTGSPAKWTAALTWDFSNATVGADGANILYSDMAWRFKQNNNPATYTAVSGVSEGVPMLFHHALAQINIKAYASGTGLTAGTGKVSDTNAEWVISLENVTITPIYTAGTLSMTNTDPENDATRNPWTVTGTGWTGTGTAGSLTRAASPAYNVEEVAKDDATDVIAATCVIPQNLYVDESLDVKLSFDMRIATTYKQNPTNPNTEVIHKEISFHTMGTDVWNQNTKYTYYLNIVPSQNKVLFDPALEEEWATGTTIDQTI